MCELPKVYKRILRYANGMVNWIHACIRYKSIEIMISMNLQNMLPDT